MMFLLSITFNILFLFIILFNNTIIFIKLKKIIYAKKALSLQLSLVLSQIKKQKFKATPAQASDLAFFAQKTGFIKEIFPVFSMDTINNWHKTYIQNKDNSTKNEGRPKICQYVRDLVISIHLKNKKLTCRKIEGIINNLGHPISRETIRKIIKDYYYHNKYKPTGKWANFIRKNINALYAMDFKVTENINGKQYYMLFFIALFNRKIIHYNVTDSPNKNWIIQQLREFTDGYQKRYLITDNDIMFKHIDFDMFNIKRKKIRFYTPNMNAYIERFIRSFNNEALYLYPGKNYNEQFLRYICRQYVEYYNNYRPHQGLGNVVIPNFPFSQNKYVKDHQIDIQSLKTKKFLDGNHIHFYYKKCA